MKQYKLAVVVFFLFLIGSNYGYSQVNQINQPYSFLYFHKNLKSTYQDSAINHTALKPFVKPVLDPDLQLIVKGTSRSWLHRKIFQEHLVQVVKEDHAFYLDFMPDFIVGKQVGSVNKTLWTNSRGFQLGLNILDKFNLFVDFYENQGTFPTHIDSVRNIIGALPGQGFSKTPKNGKYDWMNTTVNLGYHISPKVHFNLAYDRIHIGEGYRSMLLSNNPYNYSFAKISGGSGNWQFNSIWAYLLDRKHPRVSSEEEDGVPRFGDGIKYAAFQYIDYSFSQKLSVGAFHSLIWADEKDSSKFTVNGGLGLNVKYNPWKNIIFYGQVYSDDLSKFSLSRKSDRRTAYQIGGHVYEAFDVKRLNFTIEYNQAAPNTYKHENDRIAYTSNAEFFSHPRGADYKEIIGFASYQWHNWSVFAQSLLSTYGNPDEIVDFNKIITNTANYKIAGIGKNRMLYNELNLSYLINPKYNLRFELGLINRVNKEFSTNTVDKSSIVTFGLRSSFRKFQIEY